MGDMETTGWTGPFAARLAQGERPYVDFVLPIPPGSLLLLAAVQKLSGRFVLLQELVVIATIDFLLALLSYAIAVRLTTRLNAVLAAAGTLVLVIQLPKECLYDHTALLFAWSSIALGVRGLLEQGARRTRYLVLTGFFAAFTVAFKLSTGLGIVAAWLGGLGYLALIGGARSSVDSSAPRRDARAFGAGVGLGVVATLGVVLASGAGLAAYFQSVVWDVPRLNGGSRALFGNFAKYLFLHETFPSGLVLTAAVIAVGLRVGRLSSGFHLGDEPVRGPSLDLRRTLGVALLLVAVFGTAILLLIGEARALPQPVISTALWLRGVPMFGLAFGSAFFVGHLLKKEDADPPTIQRGHVFNAVFLVAALCSLFHGMSLVQFFTFYDGNPLIPISFVFLFAAADRSKIVGLKALLITLSLAGLFSLKLNRALSADIPVKAGNWAGMRVNYRGQELLDAAARAQALAGPDESVLVLPEDAQLSALIGRPRPKLRGALVFVDQYPDRLLDADLAALEREPPKVIVIHPRQRAQWERLYSTWSDHSAAERFLQFVVDRLLPERYRRDSTFRTTFFWDQGQLDVFVRSDHPLAGLER
jgi:hypothetical protein